MELQLQLKTVQTQTVSTVSKNLGISTRMLRYYEQIGLIESQRKEDYSYRVYDETAVRRLRQIILLRKLRIPVKQIKDILTNQGITTAIEVFQENINELDEEISALSTIRNILGDFVRLFEEKINIKETFDLLSDESVSGLVSSLNLPKNYIKEENSMSELNDFNKADEKLNKLKDRDVRIVYLPPATVASIHHIGCSPQGEIPESTTGIMMRDFIKNNNLAKIKPDLRHYGFNHPARKDPDKHGYERWITIPENMDVPEPFVKKQFAGGLYAVYTITCEDWDEWPWLWEWVENNKKYEFNLGDPECMNGLLEEYLNHIDLKLSPEKYYDKVWQIDLLIPVKEK